jgi:hypothetical protein
LPFAERLAYHGRKGNDRHGVEDRKRSFFSHNERRKMYFERGKKFLLSTFMGRENSQNYRLRTGTREGKEEWEEREGKRRGGW